MGEEEDEEEEEEGEKKEMTKSSRREKQGEAGIGRVSEGAVQLRERMWEVIAEAEREEKTTGSRGREVGRSAGGGGGGRLEEVRLVVREEGGLISVHFLTCRELLRKRKEEEGKGQRQHTPFHPAECIH